MSDTAKWLLFIAGICAFAVGYPLTIWMIADPDSPLRLWLRKRLVGR
jgi:hypothetical protein